MAFASSDLTFTVDFCLDVESATFGKFILTDTSTAAYAAEGISLDDIQGVWTIIYPNGTTRLGDFGSPDISGGATVFNTLAIPKDANNAFLEGTYTFSYSVLVFAPSPPGAFFNLSNTYDFCPFVTPVSTIDPVKGALAAITVEVDCFCLKITATDGTDYGNPTTTARVISIFPPPSLGLATATGSAASLVYAFSYTGGYEINVNTLLTYVSTIFTTTVRVDSSVYKNVLCDRDLCGIITCFNTYYNDTLAKAAEFAGFKNLTTQEQDKWFQVNGAMVSFDSNLKCGNWAEADTAYNTLKILLDCNCACTEDDAPKLVNPYCTGTGSNNSISIVAAGTGIEVTSAVVGATTTYTVAVAAATLASIVTNTADILVNTTAIALITDSYKLLENNLTGVGTDANTSEKTLMTYTLPAATMANNSDRVRLTAYLTYAANVNQKTVRLYFGASVGLAVVPADNVSLIQGTITVEVNRTAAATQDLETSSSLVKSNFIATNFGPVKTTGAETLSGTIIIKVTGQNTVATVNDIICERMTVEYFKKS